MGFKESEVGLIPEDWDVVELKLKASITMGQSPKSESYNSEGLGIPFMQGRKTFGDKYHDIDTWCTDPKRLANKGDILMSVRAPVGDVNVATTDLCIGRGLASLKMLNGNNEFLYYLLKSYVGEITSRETGTVFASINKKGLETIKLPFPSDKEQRLIANILSALDEKIETNNQINKKLEEMAQVLFKHWFVNFEFPNENGKPYKSSGGEMVEGELGLVPKGWNVGCLSDLIEVRYGKDHKKLKEGLIPVYGSGGVIRYVDTALYTSESVLVPRKGTLNNVMYINHPFWSVDTMFYTVMKEQEIAKYIYCFLKTKDLVSMNIGSAVPSMTTAILNKMPIIIQPLEIINRFNRILDPIFAHMGLLLEENKRLAELRDNLLAKLMSGEISVC